MGTRCGSIHTFPSQGTETSQPMFQLPLPFSPSAAHAGSPAEGPCGLPQSRGSSDHAGLCASDCPVLILYPGYLLMFKALIPSENHCSLLTSTSQTPSRPERPFHQLPAFWKQCGSQIRKKTSQFYQPKHLSSSLAHVLSIIAMEQVCTSSLFLMFFYLIFIRLVLPWNGAYILTWLRNNRFLMKLLD